jgi:hypothetical protein
MIGPSSVRNAAEDYFFGAIIEPPILSQVPLSTYFQSPLSLSFVAVPAHECEPVALAQSLAPALAMPKHLSLDGVGGDRGGVGGDGADGEDGGEGGADEELLVHGTP